MSHLLSLALLVIGVCLLIAHFVDIKRTHKRNG
jgi:hypothetical protein